MHIAHKTPPGALSDCAITTISHFIILTIASIASFIILIQILNLGLHELQNALVEVGPGPSVQAGSEADCQIGGDRVSQTFRLAEYFFVYSVGCGKFGRVFRSG